MTLPEEEKKILEYWDSISMIDLVLKAKKEKGRFQFTEGPPTANGLPGIHHVYSRSIKDIILRYRFMEGYHVPRKAGWDTHGLPVELEVEKELHFTKKKDILDYGIDKFNKKCKESVFKYVGEWEKLTSRMAFWLDMKNPYITCDKDYIESIWWSLKKLFDMGKIYKGRKVVPFCPRCETALSSHELSQGYENVTETSVYITFKIKDPNFEGVKFVAWTTTPWTLLSNLALAVNPNSRYALIEWKDEKLIIATELLDTVLGTGTYKVVREIFGDDMKYKKYEPLFPYFAHLEKENGFIVVTGDFVTTEPTTDNVSTGFVHIAPAFGEDDYNVGMEFKLPFLQPISEKGFFDDSIPELAGKYFKIDRDDAGKKGAWDTDAWVIDQLKKQGKLLGTRDYAHDYPFCWRCKRALLYYARESWFVNTASFKDDLVDFNKQVNWVPATIGEGRFGNFLESVRDWAISRERFWGTPLPLWLCSNPTCNHITAVGSYAELEARSKGHVIMNDYHKPMIDEVLIPCEKCGKDMLRTPEVIDCWYDSGAAPFAQYHYPFENKELVEDGGAYPMDFIAEGMDQTRGWFYTLHAIATMVFNHIGFKNVVVNGIVNDEQGRKMSKSLKNIIDPWTIFDNQGADAIRFYYYVSGPPHKEKSMSLESIRLIVSQFITKYWNSFKLFSQNVEATGMKPNVKFDPGKVTNPLDAWMLHRTNLAIKAVKNELDVYNIYPAAVAVQEFVDNALSNWYLRLSRKRFVEGDQDVYDVTFYVFDRVNRLLAPFVPFVTEKIFIEMQGILGYAKGVKSVHLLDYPVPDEKFMDERVIDEMKFIELLVQDMRATRDAAKIKTRQPVKDYVLHVKDAAKAGMLGKYKDFLASELNFKDLAIVDEKDAASRFSITVKLNPGAIGRDFKKDKQKVEAFLKQQDPCDLLTKVAKGTWMVEIGGTEREITQEHVQVEYEGKAPYTVRVLPYGTVLLNTELDATLEREGLARDLIRNVQNIRKRMNLSRHKETIVINIPGKELDVAAELGEFIDLVKAETRCTGFGTAMDGTEFPVQVGDKKFKVYVKVG